MANYKVALDAGHGGSDPGAVFNGRQEKDDTLDLALAVGDILKKNGVDVFYTRTTDEYETPFKKATDANNSNADLFVSIHRNSSEFPNQYSGVQTLVFSDSGLKAEAARNINNQLEAVGFKNLGVDERKNLVVLKRTKMPAVLVEAGFINNEKDNYIFDHEFDHIAQAIADGILESIPQGVNSKASLSTVSGSEVTNPITPDTATVNQTAVNQAAPVPENTYINTPAMNTSTNEMTASNNSCPCTQSPEYDDNYMQRPLYRVQTGAFRNKENADRMLNSLLIDGFPAFIIYEDGYYKVQVGAYAMLSNAIKMEQRLRRFHYNTYITV